MNEFTSEQIAISTAEDERNYFTGRPEISVQPDPSTILPPGTYRVIDGNLYRISRDVPPSFAAINSPESSLARVSSDQK